MPFGLLGTWCWMVMFQCIYLTWLPIFPVQSVWRLTSLKISKVQTHPSLSFCAETRNPSKTMSSSQQAANATSRLYWSCTASEMSLTAKTSAIPIHGVGSEPLRIQNCSTAEIHGRTAKKKPDYNLIVRAFIWEEVKQDFSFDSMNVISVFSFQPSFNNVCM